MDKADTREQRQRWYDKNPFRTGFTEKERRLVLLLEYEAYLLRLRSHRDATEPGELRQEYNKVCDRLDVLISKLDVSL